MIHHLKLHFVSPSTFTTEQITAQYDYLLVFTSILIAIFASYISFLLSARIKSSQLKNEAVIWTFLSSCFLGVGIWAMHFVGMLAYKLPVEVNYDLTITLYSILPSVFASYIVISTDLGRAKSLLLRSLLMAAGIGSMHFYGMMAMIMPAHMTYEPWLFSLSILVAAVLSGLALKINDLRQTRTAISLHANLLSALVMGYAISGMHYIGMISMYVFESKQIVYIPANSNPELTEVIISEVCQK